MTTYLLHGGKITIDSESNRLLFTQFTSLVPKDNVKILMCYFAKEKSDGEMSFIKDREQVLANTIKNTEIVKIDTITSLKNELKDADVLYVSGGEEGFLRPYMPQLSFLKEALQNKIYIGTSMGAFFAAKYYVLSLSNQNEGDVYDGLSLIPYNLLCHWNVETKKEKKIAMLKEKDPSTPILCIEEQRFEKIVV